MAGPPHGFPVQALKLWVPKPNPEQAIVPVERAESSEIGSALQEGCLRKTETTELVKINDESARQSLISGDDVEGNGQVSGVLLISDTPNKKTLFKNDCGLLKLLPSKRKFAWEDMDSPSPCHKPEHRKRCLVQFGEESNRRRSCSDSSNVGSFMKWMIDVGKGLAKKRCFPTPLASTAQHSTNPCFEDSPNNNALIVAEVQNHQGQNVQEQPNDHVDGDTFLIPTTPKENVTYDHQEANTVRATEGTKCSDDPTPIEGEPKPTTATTAQKSEAQIAQPEEAVEIVKQESRTIQDDAIEESQCQDSSPEFAESMATVESWVHNNFKCSWERRKNNSVTSLNCRYCGLPGHSVSDCSETLDCEVKELERRETLLDEMIGEVEEFPCLRCLGMGHIGAQCRFSVSEAASRARENSELRKWEFTRSSRRPASEKPASTSLLFQRYKETTHRLKPRDETKAKQVPEAPVEKKGRRKNQPPKACLRSEAAPVVPKGFFAAVESVRLSRSELWSLESSEYSTRTRGFFLRLRFGRWEKAMGGTGYRMARIRGTIRKSGDDKSMSVSVDLGDMDCTVDSQYVSNHCFTEAELVEWWKGRWRSGRRLISQAELQTKLAQRQVKP